jgi:hypothetical protein
MSSTNNGAIIFGELRLYGLENKIVPMLNAVKTYGGVEV